MRALYFLFCYIVATQIFQKDLIKDVEGDRGVNKVTYLREDDQNNQCRKTNLNTICQLQISKPKEYVVK